MSINQYPSPMDVPYGTMEPSPMEPMESYVAYGVLELDQSILRRNIAEQGA
jgi:hypothetical protein